ncbi:MAG: histidinol-phosphate transaminase [Desulfobulbaceae bacterium]|uniref:Histidinol-phosphate aminotransferase n=1 Tax=Candidatus Desulfatifera sulfidica TaxID=2841691 RepID=A0A8J6N9J0_9BACT|nr:histidinol-phosphate transaminase [Candidatus Desulfatifera sulfidica]
MKLQVPEHIAAIVPYPPGKPQDELEREYGIRDSIKMASNENPWGPSPKAVAAIADSLNNLHRYPDGSCYSLVQSIADKLRFDPEQIVMGNGSNEVIEFLVKAFVQRGDEVITSHPSFLMYQKIVQVRGGTNTVVPLREMNHDLPAILKTITEKTRLIFLDNPNNPTATVIDPNALEDFLFRVPEGVIVVLDEAYIDFVDSGLRPDLHSLIRDRASRCAVVSLRTFSKAYGLAGLRVGFGLMSPRIADCLHRVRQPFNVNNLAQIGALAALEDNEFYELGLQRNRDGLAFLQRELAALGCRCYPSQTNFFLTDILGDAAELYEAMLYKGVIIRSMKPYGYSHLIRITVGTTDENERLVVALAECLRDLGRV